MTPRPRLQVVVDALALAPDHDVIEIGPGHGVAASYVLERLVAGRYLGIDRSDAMVQAATRRNREAVDAGRARFVAAGLGEIEAGPGDVLLACRVRELVTPVGLAAARVLLRPGGRLVVAFDAPEPARAAAAARDGRAAISSAGYVGAAVTAMPFDGGDVHVVVATRG